MVRMARSNTRQMRVLDGSDEVPRIYTYQHRWIDRVLSTLHMLDSKGVAKVTTLVLPFALIWFAIFLVGLLEGVSLPKYGLKVPVLYDVALYCLSFGVGPLYLYCTTRFDFELSQFIRWLVREQRVLLGQADLARELAGLQQLSRSIWTSRISLVLAAVVVLGWILPEATNQQWTWPTRMGSGEWETPTVAGLILCLYLMVINYILFCHLATVVGWYWFLSRIASYPLRVDPIHPDLCGGFGPINLVQKVNGYLACGIGIYIASVVFNNCFYLGPPIARIDNVILVIHMVITPLAYLFPLLFFIRPLLRSKQDALTWVDSLANETGDQVKSVLAQPNRDLLTAAPYLEFGLFLASYRDHITSMRVILLDAKGLKKFLALAYSPLLAFVIPFLPETLQKVASLIR